MLFQSSIRRELARSFGATLVVIVTIVLTIVLIRTLGQASRGVINPQDVMLFMAYSALGRLPTILTLSLFIAMVGTLSRMYRDSEMVVWFTSGQGLAAFLRPLFRFSWPVLLIIALMSLVVWPWTNQQTKNMKERFEGRSDIDRIAPGQFQESSNGNRVFFIDRDATTAQKSSSNVFIAATEKGKSSVTTARSGRLDMRGDSQILVLEKGQRLENETGKSALKVSDFEEYGTKMGDSTAVATDMSDAKLLSVPALVKTPTRANTSELAWRLGLGLAAVNFVVLAAALASVNPRGGRSGNLVFVVLTFLVYNNLINLSQSWIFGGAISFGPLLVLLHGGVLFLGLAWLAKRHFNWTLRAALRSRKAAGSGGAPTVGRNPA
ncbi:MAG: permease YjgP/YjgQ [Polaromonas sp.]|nr:permease YjgP/YjgQ [Polaromonas sp.]